MTSFQVVAAHVDRGKELYLFGRDANGGSVAVALQDVRPYLWVAAPPAGEAAAFVAQVNSRLASAAPAGQSSSSWGAKPAAAAVQAGETREFLRFTGGYDPKPRPFLKLVMQSARDAYAVRDACGAAELAEADIDFAAQACADLGIAPGAWAELGPAAQPAKMPGVRADACFRAPASALVARPDLTGNAPLRVLAFDIETLTRDLGNGAVKFYAGDDPEARCVCIAACDVAVGRPGSGRRTVFALDPDAKEPRVATEGEVEIRYLLDEAALLRAFAAHVRDRDPDFLSGWNTDSFDLEWLAAAAARVGAEPDLWAGLSRFDRDPARHRAAKPGLKVRLSAPGRVPYDLMQWFKKNRNLEQYGLNFVAGLFNCGAKDDVSYSDIGRLFQTEEGRRKLALYCEQDTSLVLRLLAAPELDPLGKDMALCAITGVFPADLLGRGTQHTLRCKVLRVAHARGFVLPYVPRDARDKTDKPESEEEDAVGFQVCLCFFGYAWYPAVWLWSLRGGAGALGR